MDLANSIIFSNFEVYLEHLNHWKFYCQISDIQKFEIGSLKFEFKTFSFKCIDISNYILAKIIL